MLKIFINNERVICKNDILMTEELQNPSSILLYKVYPYSWKGTNRLLTDFYFPKDYSNCEIYNDNELIFSGIVKSSNTTSLKPNYPHYCDIQVIDYKTLLSEGETLDFVIKDKTLYEAIQMVVNAYSGYGFVLGNIDISSANDIINAYSTYKNTPYDVFQYFSEISGSIWKTRFIDKDTVAIDFYDRDKIESDGTILYDTEYFSQNKIDDITYSFSTENYRNKQIILSDEIFSNVFQNEIKISNGYDNSFLTSYKIGNISKITVDNEEKSFATNSEKEVGIIADFYYTPTENVITSDNVQPFGSQIKITYQPIVQGRQIALNDEEINRISNSTSRTGIISRYESRNDAFSNEELNKIAKTYIKYNSKAEIELTISTRKPFLTLGNKVFFNSPVEDLKDEYFVKTKKTNIVFSNENEEFIKYEYILSNNFNAENELNYFDNQRRKQTGNIGVGEYISRNYDIENTANIIFYNTTVEEIEISGDNVLNAPLNAPLVK